MRDWQNSPSLRNQRLLTFLRSRSHNYAMSMKGLSLAFSPNFINQIRNEDYLKQLNPRFTEVGVTVGLVNNLIEILIVYIDTWNIDYIALILNEIIFKMVYCYFWIIWQNKNGNKCLLRTIKNLIRSHQKIWHQSWLMCPLLSIHSGGVDLNIYYFL